MLSFTGFGLGVLLLLCAAQMFVNINTALQEKNIRKDGFDFLSVTKNITDQNMGQENMFSVQEVQAMKQQSFIADAAPLLSNQFRAKASAGNIIPFNTDLFLEAIQNDFLDTLPPNFSWKPGQQDVPVIFSADFLEMYNVFAPAQDLPQVSASTIGAVNINIECYGAMFQKMNFRGHIVAVSDRINSVLVPKAFLEWANLTLASSTDPPSARVYIKTKDASDPQLLKFLQEKDYRVNKDRTKFGGARQALQVVVSSLAGFAILVILLAMMLFSFFLQLTIARSKDNLQLLLQLGYSPAWLSKALSGKWFPVYATIIVLALVLTQGLQLLMREFFTMGVNQLPSILHWSVWLLAVALFALCIVSTTMQVRKSLYKL